MNRRIWLIFGCALPAMAFAATVRADQVTFKNGDKVTGKIESMDGGKLKIATDSAGELTVDMANVANFTTDAPIEVDTADGKIYNIQSVGGGAPDYINSADGQIIAFANIQKINPPAQVWTGSLTLNANASNGNTVTSTFGFAVDAELRRKRPGVDDRTTLDGAYNFGRTKDPVTGARLTTTDNWMAEGKYDKFFTEKFYGYGDVKAEHDRIAKLNYRLAPGVGVGYQWVERPDFSFNTEAGVSYVHEDFTTHDTNDYVALRMAYHLTKQLTKTISAFHDLEWLPAFDDPSKYTLDTDAGFHFDITTKMFLQFKFEWKRNSDPAPGALKNDLFYTLGAGWKF